MFTKSLLAAVLLSLAFLQTSPEENAKKDLDLMQGTWDLQALEINGKEVPPLQLDGTVLVIKGDEYHTKMKTKMLFGFRIKLDPSKEPKTIDMIQTQPDGSEKVIKGIYKFEKDTFLMARGLEANQERPNQFATWPNTDYFVVTWKKQ